MKGVYYISMVFKITKILGVLFLLSTLTVFLAACDNGDIPEETYTLTVKIDGEGTVIPKEGEHDKDADTVVDLAATPAAEWEFGHWVGEVAETNSAETTVVMDADKEVTAVFVEKPKTEVSDSDDLIAALENNNVERIIFTDDIKVTEDKYKVLRDITIKGESYSLEDNLIIGEEKNIDVDIVKLTVEGKTTVDIGNGKINFIDSSLEKVDINSVGTESFNMQDNSTAQIITNNVSEAKMTFDDNATAEQVNFEESASVTGASSIKNALVNSENVKMDEEPENIDEDSKHEPIITVEFPDENMEEAVRDKINKPDGDLYLSDIIAIEELNASKKDIESIEGIQYLKNLAELYFRSNAVSDISVLENLTYLEMLEFTNNEVSDIGVLENLTNLEGLYFSNNEVSDISVLENLTNLERLSFSNNEVSNISVLENLTELELLAFSNNEVSDISVLENLTELKQLNFEYNEVDNITALVKNNGLGEGDYIDMQENYLDLTEGSKDLDNINTLIDREVNVKYEPQK